MYYSHYNKEKGYEFVIGGASRIYYGTIAVISADNPASNGLGGFKESTAATHYCRQCKADSSEAISVVCATWLCISLHS